MAINYYVQVQPFSLAGAGAATGDATISLSSFTQIDGTLLTMTDFGGKGYATLEPGSGTSEEAITFTGVTQNANGSATLTGVKHVLFVNPYTETAGINQDHAGGTRLVISNLAAFYKNFANVNANEAIFGSWQFQNTAVPAYNVDPVFTLQTQLVSKGYVDSVVLVGAPNATTAVQGVVQLPTQAQVDAKTSLGSTGAALVVIPPTMRSTQLNDYVATDTGVADAYVIAPAIAITAYAAGQRFTFKAATTNTGASTIAVSGLAVRSITKNGTFALQAGDIVAGAIYDIEDDGTRYQLLSRSAPQVSNNGKEIYAATASGNDTYAVTIAPAFALINGAEIRVKLDVANTAAATMNVNGGGALGIVKGVSTALETGDLLANQVISLKYNSTGTVWQLLDVPTNLVTGITTPIITQHAHKRTSFVDVYNMNTTSGTVNYAHGLGVKPNWVKVTALMGPYGGAASSTSFGTYDAVATTYATIIQISSQSNTETTKIVNLNDGTGNTQVATVGTLDTTNVPLVWTKGGASGSVVIALLFECGV